MIKIKFNDEILYLTEDGWHNLADLVKEGDEIKIIGVKDD